MNISYEEAVFIECFAVVTTQRKTISRLVFDSFCCRRDIIPSLEIRPLVTFAYELLAELIVPEGHAPCEVPI